MEPPPRSKCKNCEGYIDSMLAGLKEEVEENERLAEQVIKLKQKNSEEKKRHNDTNNQIIMSNVKYQQALHEAHKAVLKYNRERDEFVSKEIDAASMKAELEAVRNINKQLLEILKVNIADLPVVKPMQGPNQPRDSANTVRKDKVKNPNKGLHVRTASEANSETYLSVAAKMLKAKPSPKIATKGTTKETEVPKPASKIRVFEDDSSESDNNTSTDSNMSIDYGSDEDTHQENEDQQDTTSHNHADAPLPQRSTTQQSKIKEKHLSTSDSVKESKNPSSGFDKTDHQREQRGTYQFRRSKPTSYAEPSLRVKMRRGDSHTNIIPEYVVRPYIRSYNNENVPP